MKQEDWVLCRVFHKNKELLAAKQGSGSSNIYHDNDTISSSSLPPLMDPYNITFDQTQPNNNLNMNELYYEQVPCFSIFSPNQTFTSHSHHHHLPAVTGSTPITAACGGFPADIGNYLSATATSSTCDNKVIKAVLSHLSTKNIMEGSNNFNNPGQNIVNIKGGNSPSFGEGSSETSFLSEVAYPTMWNNY
ncbi:hypothetical protein HAX54_050296 [Datura stramonium]|uniref:NAC domain-containing protein n=1 Tax=Datura stramonium TaxID=4076 RepID=A0ABS8WL79_DATST|nr:hypothetical protein [Datura stramonium]